MGKTTDDMIDTDFDTGAEPVDMTLPASSGTTPLGVQPSGTLAGSSTTDAIGTYGSDLDHATQHTAGTTGDDEIEQAREQIEHTRAHMSQTIDAIQYKLSPEHIAQQAKDTVRDATIGKAQTMVNNAGDTARGMGSGIIETIKQNPIPAALAGIGIGWLFVSGRKSSSQGDGTSYRYRSYDYGSNYGYDRTSGGAYGYDRTPTGAYRYDRGYGDGGYDNGGIGGRVSNMAGQMQNTAGQVAGSVSDTASQVAGTVQDTASQVAGTVTDAAGQVAGTAQNLASQAGEGISNLGYQAQYGAQRAQSGFQQLMYENPMAVAAGAVALGLAVGLAIPETEKENELLGPTRDQLMEQAQQQVSQVAQKAQTAAQHAVGAAKDAAQQAVTESTDSQ
jgi:uncharacterized protein YjbJ (UPF0337 family)